MLFAATAFAANQIELPVRQFFVEFAADADGQFELDQRMGADELPKHFRQTRRHEILGGAEAQPPAQLGAGKVAFRPLIRRQDTAGEFDHGLAVSGHRHRMGVADEKAAPGLLLKFSDVSSSRSSIKRILE